MDSSSDGTVAAVKVIYENQRYYGPMVGWGPSPLLEMPPWTNEQLHPVSAQIQDLECSDSWAVAVTPGTDQDGWMYSSRFRNISNQRPGGRSTLRTSDFVRRRRWIYEDSGGRDEGKGKNGGVGMAYFEQLPANSMSSVLLSQINGNRRYAAMKGLKSFIGLFADMLERRQLWEVLPWDPSAWLYIQRKHYTDMREMQTENLANTINTWLELHSSSNSSTPDSSFTSSRSSKPTQDVRQLLDKLQCAAVFSRAAYGYAMAAGHLSSVMNFAYVATFHRAAHGFDAISGASDEANNEATCALAGIAKEDLLMTEWKSSTFRPCHFVAIDRSRQQIVISIRGTVQLADALTDLTAMPMVVSLAGTTGTVHEGLLSAATYVHCNTVHALEVAARKFPSWPLLVTGHSLGAGVAVLLTMLLREKGGAPVGIQEAGISCVSMGTPAVMCQKFADLCVPFVTSCIYRSDNVPRLSYATVEKLLMELVDNSPMRRAAQEIFKSTHATIQSVSTILNCNPIQQIFPTQEEEQQQFSQTPESFFSNSFKSQINGLEDIKDLASPEKESNHAAMVTYRSLNMNGKTSLQPSLINDSKSIELQELKFDDNLVIVVNDDDDGQLFQSINSKNDQIVYNSNNAYNDSTCEFDFVEDVRWLDSQDENKTEDEFIEVIFDYQFLENQDCTIKTTFQISKKSKTTQRSSFFSPAHTLEAENSFISAIDQLSSGTVEAMFGTSPSSQLCTNPSLDNSTFDTFDTFFKYGIMRGQENGENPPPESLYPPGRVYWILPSSVAEEQELQEVQILPSERKNSGLRSAGQRILSMSSTDLRSVKQSVERSINHPDLIGIQSPYVQYAQHVEFADDMSMTSVDASASALLSSVFDEDMDNVKPVSKVGKRDVEWLNQWLLHHQNDALELGGPPLFTPTPAPFADPDPTPQNNFFGWGRGRGMHKRSLSHQLLDSFSSMKNGLARSLSKSSQMWREQYLKYQQRDQNSLVIAEVDRKCFDRLLLTTELVSDHLPDVYLEAIKSL